MYFTLTDIREKGPFTAAGIHPNDVDGLIEAAAYCERRAKNNADWMYAAIWQKYADNFLKLAISRDMQSARMYSRG